MGYISILCISNLVWYLGEKVNLHVAYPPPTDMTTLPWVGGRMTTFLEKIVMCRVYVVSEHGEFVAILRAGLRVCPWKEWRLKEAHFWLWYIFGLRCSTSNVWIFLSEKWTLCGLHACRPFPVFNFFGESGVFMWYNGITCINPTWNPNRNMVNCSMGPGDSMTCINPKWNPNRK